MSRREITFYPTSARHAVVYYPALYFALFDDAISVDLPFSRGWKKKKRETEEKMGEKEKERRIFWPLIGLNRIDDALLELGDWKLGSRQTFHAKDTFVALFFSPFFFFFFHRISIIESEAIPNDSFEKQATRNDWTHYRIESICSRNERSSRTDLIRVVETAHYFSRINEISTTSYFERMARAKYSSGVSYEI